MEAAVLAQDPALDVPARARRRARARGRRRTSTACPYKGLATYQATDAELFHGRDRMVTRLVARLVDAPFVAVSGSSGAGKSSLVRAGLLPALARGALPGNRGVEAIVVTHFREPPRRRARRTRR